MAASATVQPRTRLTLCRDQRLRGSRSFLDVRTAGERRVCGFFVMNWKRLDAGRQSRLGVITSRKIGGSVVRSRARRLLREAYRNEQHRLNGPVTLVLVARRSLVGQSFATVSRALHRCLREAGLLGNPQTPSLACAPSP